jgi:very-short-patch-repair endonuclease
VRRAQPPTDAVERVLSRADLLALGYSPKRITRDVRSGALTRLRRDHYVIQSDAAADAAVRIGGRLTCVSALATTGVFVHDASVLHVHVERTASRLRSPGDSRMRWSGANEPLVRLHWGTAADAAGSRDTVSLSDAVRTLVRCQPPRHVVATLDSLLHNGVVSMSDLRDAFATLPPRYRVVLALVDGRSESGTESLVRLTLRQLGASFDLQVAIIGVGRVDFVVDGWLIIECDSKAHHEGWKRQRDDRRRDLEAARRGYTTIRLLAEDILYRPQFVQSALAEVIASRAA